MVVPSLRNAGSGNRALARACRSISLWFAIVVVAALLVWAGDSNAAEDARSTRAASAGARFMLTGTGVWAPVYSDPTATDAHPIGRNDQSGVGFRVDGRYRPIEWFAVGLGGDYLQSTTSAPSRHLAFPVIASFTPLHISILDLGLALGGGPAWSWYQAPGYAESGGVLRASGELWEVRLEGGIAILPRVSVQTTVGARLYRDNFSNAVSYASDGVESPAAAIDVGLGLRGFF